MARDDDDDFDDDEEEEEIDYVLFQGAINNAEVDLEANQRLTHAGLLPAKELVTDALLRRANRLRVEPKGQAVQVTMYIDGIAYPGGRMSKQQGLAITQMIKLLAGLDISIRDQVQLGGMKAELEEIPYVLRVKAEPLGGGAERLTVTARETKNFSEAPRDLGFTDRMRDAIREKSSSRRGLILVAGPPFSGVTTTAIGTVRAVDAFMYTIFTIADMEGRDITNVQPFKIREGEDLEGVIERIHRVDGDVLFMQPIRSEETAGEYFQHTEKLSLITEMPARDAAHAIAQLCSWLGGEKVAESLDLVIGSKLIRTLCTKCRQAFRPNPRLLEKLNLPPETRLLYRHYVPPEPEFEDDEEFEEPEICEKCGGIGYMGLAAMYEMIEINDEIKQLLQREPTPAQIKAAAKNLGMQTLQADAVRLVGEGKTSLEELQRVFRSGG